MKILRLNLIAVGPFTDVSLDLSGGQHGLHVILGRNEAGKSSSLRALRSFLYGFPGQTSDNFIHEHSRLRVGAVLRHSDGTEITLIRRKGNQNTLLDGEGKAIDDGILDRFLGNVTQQQFETFFGLGHADLRDGGEEILRGGGKVGESLFAAGAGGLRLRKLKQKIEEEAESIYKPRSRNAKIPTALSKFNDMMKTVGQLSLSVEKWAEHDQELSKAKKDAADVKHQLDELSTQRNRLERLQRAIPLVARRRAAMDTIAILGDVPSLGDDFAEDRRNVAREIKDAQEQGSALSADISRLEAEIAGIQIPEELLRQAQSIELLNTQLRAYQQARQEAPALRIRRDEASRDAKRILRSVRPDVPIGEVEQLRLGTARVEEIQLLSREAESLKQSVKAASGLLEELKEDRRQADLELRGLAASRDVKALQAAIASIQKHGDLEKLLADETANLKLQTRRAEANIAKLGLWSGSVEALEKLQVPSMESIEHARSRQEKLAADQEKLEQEIHRLETELVEIDHKLQLLRAGGEIPTDERLRQARDDRAHGWALVRQAWLDGAPVDEAVKKYSAGVPLAEAFERSVANADVVADALRGESDRVAQQASLVAQKKLLDGKLLGQRQRVPELKSALAQAIGDWKSLWARIRIEPLTPKEMQAWATRQLALAEAATKIVEATEQLAERQRQITGHRQLLMHALGEIGETADADESLAGLLGRAGNVVEQVRQEAIERKQLQADIKTFDVKIAKSNDATCAAEKELAAWESRWEHSVSGLGVRAATDPVVALAIVKQIDELFLKIDLAQKTEIDIAARQSQIDAFEKQTAELVSSLAPDTPGSPSDQAMVSLYARLKQARADDAKQKALVAQLQQARRNLDKNRLRAQSATKAQTTLLDRAACTNVDQLPALEERYAALMQCVADRAQSEREVRLLGNGESLDDLVAQVISLNADELPTQLAELRGRVDTLQIRRSEIDKKIGEEELTLRQMDGNGKAGEAAERAQELLADLRENAETYARLNLAAAVLKRGIDRYRQRKQGPLLSRASELFGELTLGSFGGLAAEFDDNDQPVLVGTRGNGSVNVMNMSDGTRDQLYLALRLATLEDFLSRGEPIPFIVDDILVNFDNPRSQATLKILAELSTKTQVILFTHHSHIAALAGDIGSRVFQLDLPNRVPGNSNLLIGS